MKSFLESLNKLISGPVFEADSHVVDEKEAAEVSDDLGVQSLFGEMSGVPDTIEAAEKFLNGENLTDDEQNTVTIIRAAVEAGIDVSEQLSRFVRREQAHANRAEILKNEGIPDYEAGLDSVARLIDRIKKEN